MEYQSVAAMVAHQIKMFGLSSVGYGTQGQFPSLSQIEQAIQDDRVQYLFSSELFQVRLKYPDAKDNYYLVRRFDLR